MPTPEELIASIQTRLLDMEKDVANLKGDDRAKLQGKIDALEIKLNDLAAKPISKPTSQDPPPVTKPVPKDPLAAMLDGDAA